MKPFLLSLCLLLPVAALVAAEPVTLKSQGRVLELSPTIDARGVPDEPESKRSTRMPDLLLVDDQHWIIVYNEYPTPFSTGEWSRIVTQTTHDGGQTWETRIVSEHRKDEGNWNMVRLSRLADGRLCLASATRGGGNHGYLWFSRDSGTTWDGPQDGKFHDLVGSGLVEMSRVVDLPDGTLGVFAHRETKRADRERPLLCDLFTSRDQGATWEHRATLPGETQDLCEPAILVDQGRVTLYLRDNLRRKGAGGEELPMPVVVLRGDDSGHTWQQAHLEESAKVGQPAVRLLADGRAVLFYRNSETVGVDVWIHDPLSFAGQIFPVERIPDSQLRYDVDTGAVEQLSDGRLILCWASVLREDGGRWPDKRVKLLVLEAAP